LSFSGYVILQGLIEGENITLLETIAFMQVVLGIVALTIIEIPGILTVIVKKTSLALMLSMKAEFKHQEIEMTLTEERGLVRYAPLILMGTVALPLLDYLKIFTHPIPTIHRVLITIIGYTALSALLVSEYSSIYFKLVELTKKLELLRGKLDKAVFSKVINTVLTNTDVLLPRVALVLAYTVLAILVFKDSLAKQAIVLLGITTLSSVILLYVIASSGVKASRSMMLKWEERNEEKNRMNMEKKANDEGKKGFRENSGEKKREQKAEKRNEGKNTQKIEVKKRNSLVRRERIVIPPPKRMQTKKSGEAAMESELVHMLKDLEESLEELRGKVRKTTNLRKIQ